MPEQGARSPFIRFAAFEVDLRAGELHKRGLKVKLQGQPFQILAMLLERPGEVVTREELRQKLWPAEVFVDFNQGLNNAIKKLRLALGDSAENPRFVETLARHGYRFIAPVDSLDRAFPAGAAPPRDWTFLRTRTILRRFTVSVLAFVLLVALALGLNVGKLRERLLGRPGPPHIESVAVLPLENLTGDSSQEYFVDGMTDALITDLAQISALRVISRTSVMQYKGARKPLLEIAKRLNVDAVVEGAVVRSGDRVRISAQLVHVATDKHLWAKSYEGDLRDVLALQSDAARDIVREIRIRLTAEEQMQLAHAIPVNTEAYELYLKGRYFWNKRTPEDLKKALDYFQRAIDRDRNYALAYAGLADTYDLLGNYRVAGIEEPYAKAKAAANKALEIDETLAEAHASLGFAKLWHDWDWSGAEREFKHAIALNPNYATAHHWYAVYFWAVGQLDKAIAEMQRALELDPLSLIINRNAAWTFYFARQYDRAIEQAQKAIEMDPNFALAHLTLGDAYLQKRMNEQAIAEFQRGVAHWPDFQYVVLGYAYAAAGKRGEATKILNQLKRRWPQDSQMPYPYELALIYLGLGQKDQAFVWLDRAYKRRADSLIRLRVEPFVDPLRSDPRFQDLLRRMNFPP